MVIKLKNSSRSPFEFIIITVAVIITFLGLIWLIDRGFNGFIKELFYDLFFIEPYFNDQGKLGVIFKNWFEIKQFLIYIFTTFVTILVTSISLSTYLYSRQRSKKEISYVADILESLKSNSEDLSLPKRYAEIETQIVKIKAATNKQQQLMQMEMQRKSDLITYLAHDLKTPLASVIGYLSLLDEAQGIPIEQKTKYTKVALEKAYRLEELINEFFDITRFNLQSIVLNKGKIKLAFMLQQLTDEFYPMLTPNGKKVNIQVPDDLTIVGDADKLARVFNNILKNAIAYSYENSIINITASLQKDNVVIMFTNQGDPIPSHKLETIFEKFYRLDTARSTNTGGAGLGLAIAQEIIMAHNGIISVESNMECTSFTVTIPS